MEDDKIEVRVDICAPPSVDSVTLANECNVQLSVLVIETKAGKSFVTKVTGKEFDVHVFISKSKCKRIVYIE